MEIANDRMPVASYRSLIATGILLLVDREQVT
jgi:hypothetical protein